MSLLKLFQKRAENAVASIIINLDTDSEHARQLEQSCREAYAVFLNDYIAHGFEEAEGDSAAQGHFYAQALAMAKILSTQPGHSNVELEASHLVEQQRQRAKRNYRHLREVAELVLVDQRNFLLAGHINRRAEAIGFSNPEKPFSGMETENGQPCHAFALKLMADSSLNRGQAQGLCEDAVTKMEQHIARRAEADISLFLQVYEREHATV